MGSSGSVVGSVVVVCRFCWLLCVVNPKPITEYEGETDEKIAG